MAVSVKAKAVAAASFTLVKSTSTSGESGVYSSDGKFNPVVFTTGNGLNQVQEVFRDTRTLDASASEELDLAGGLSDVFGRNINFTTVKMILIEGDVENQNDIIVGGAAANAASAGLFGDASDKITVRRKGGKFMWVAPDVGLTVTAGTGDLLKITNSAGVFPVTYTITVFGVAP